MYIYNIIRKRSSVQRIEGLTFLRGLATRKKTPEPVGPLNFIVFSVERQSIALRGLSFNRSYRPSVRVGNFQKRSRKTSTPIYCHHTIPSFDSLICRSDSLIKRFLPPAVWSSLCMLSPVQRLATQIHPFLRKIEIGR